MPVIPIQTAALRNFRDDQPWTTEKLNEAEKEAQYNVIWSPPTPSNLMANMLSLQAYFLLLILNRKQQKSYILQSRKSVSSQWLPLAGVAAIDKTAYAKTVSFDS